MRLRQLWDRIPAVVVDIALTVVVLLAQFAPFVSAQPLPGQHAWPWPMFLPVIASTVPLIWRRRAPFVVLILTELGAGAYAFFPAGPPQPIWYGALVAMFTLAALAPRWQRLSALIFIGWGAVLVTGALDTAVRGVLMWVTAYALGRVWAARGAQADALRERAHHLERERELAAARERARIARDMHDILAHGVSVMIAQAEAGPVFIGRDDARVAASFDAISVAGREAMTQLRRILGVLADDPTNASPSEARPMPRLADITGLVDQVTRAGLDVEMVESGATGELAADTQVAAFRIVQEALTNVLKHARADSGRVRVEIRLEWHEQDLTVSVTDNGATAVAANGAGHGLIGIAERAASCGGSARCGPADGGGFRVSAHLPGIRVPSLAVAR
ncbi:MAG TPA: histidine kinase [Micromonosporaceae bacterium]